MFVGNSPQHAGNVCRAFDADTCRVIATRDAKFLDKMFYRSDFTRSTLVPHVNNIVLNRLHIPNNLTIRDEDGDPVESDTDNSLGKTDEAPAADEPDLGTLLDPVIHSVRAWTDPTNDREDDQW